MKILAIDPGHTTGVVLGESEGRTDLKLLAAFELAWNDRFKLYEMAYYPAVIVIEDFRLYEHKAMSQVNSDFPSVKIIGMMELVCYLTGTTLVTKMPSVKNSVKILEEHKEMLGKSPHIQDAYKLLRYYAILRK